MCGLRFLRMWLATLRFHQPLKHGCTLTAMEYAGRPISTFKESAPLGNQASEIRTTCGEGGLRRDVVRVGKCAGVHVECVAEQG